MLLNENWDNLYEIHNPEEALQLFYNKYNHTYEASFPLKQLSPKRTKDTKWMTAGLRICANKKKNSLSKIY